jgi:hypothetical protein
MFDGYLLSFLSTYLSINDIIMLTRSSVLFREPILLETLGRRILSESSVIIDDKQVIPLTLISENGLFLFENEETSVSCSYFGQSTNNHICLCDSSETLVVLPNKMIKLNAPIAEMFHNYQNGNMIREYYDSEYTIKIYFGTHDYDLFINKIIFEIIKPELTFYERISNKFRNVKYYLYG